MSGDESEAGDGEESVAGAVGQDASSTATIGSNLLYLSDEQVLALSSELSFVSVFDLPPPPLRTPVTMKIWSLPMRPRCQVTIAMTMMSSWTTPLHSVCDCRAWVPTGPCPRTPRPLQHLPPPGPVSPGPRGAPDAAWPAPALFWLRPSPSSSGR